MNKMRLLKSVFIVCLPFVLLACYEVFSQRFMLPGLMTSLTEPLTSLSAQQQPAVMQVSEKVPTPIASGKVDLDKPAKKTFSKKGETKTKQVSRESTDAGAALHAGIKQDGRLVPALHLEISEDNIRFLLRHQVAFLIVTVDQQHYLLTSANHDEPFKLVTVTHLMKQNLSQRYFPLLRSNIPDADLKAMDAQVLKRTARYSRPQYRLVFSSAFNAQLTDTQLSKIDQMQLNLKELAAMKTEVRMIGRLIRHKNTLVMDIGSVLVGREKIGKLSE